MGRYDGILLLTDFDGTLYTGREIPQRNIEAIRRFCAEGGKFGFSSGRTQGFFKEWENVVRSNTCISAINGTLIYDYPRGEIVSEKFLPDGAFDKALRVCLEFEDYYNIAVFRRDLVDALDFGSDGLRDALRAMMSDPVYKVMFHSRHDITDSEKRAIEEIFGDDYYVSRSWASGIEIQSRDSTKGEAARFIKSFTGADLLVCAGDYENDETMIAAADIGYAVANAVDKLKALADRHTVSVGEGAIAAIIDELGSL